MNKPIEIAIPGLWQHFELTKFLIQYLQYNPDKVYPNVKIGAVYGNFPYCIWDGGRIFGELRQASMEEIVTIKNYLKEQNIPLRLIYTNPVLQPIHFSDRFCNLVCALCEDELNEIVVNNPELEAYLRKTYPKYSFISSTTKCKTLKESLAELQDYKYICLDYNQNHNQILESLTDNEKDRIEFLCNAICPPGCPNRKEHYRLNGIQYLNFYHPYQIHCQITGSTVSAEMLTSKNNISPEEIINYYHPLGYHMFKLEGRTLNGIEMLLNYARYFIKPEHQLDFINIAVAEVLNPITYTYLNR